jgi:hypothetical protein
MAEAAVKAKPDAAPTDERELTDGFHLVIEALKLNGLNTIYGVPGIPITDFGRMAQASGIRVLSFRHEQNAGYAAAIAGFLTKKPGICLTVSAPGFLNGLTALAHATTNCFPMILISGSSEREIVDLQQGDYERRGAGDPRGGVGASRRRLSRPAGQAVRAGDGRRSRPQVAGQGDRSGAGADSGGGGGEARARCP